VSVASPFGVYLVNDVCDTIRYAARNFAMAVVVVAARIMMC